MSPRSTAADAARTRSQILGEAVASASIEGLEGVTIGTLAERLGMSKAGVIGPFGSKEDLQLAAVREGIAIFRREIWEPAASQEPGLARLRAIGAAWISYLEDGVLPGGCLLTAAAAEFDGRPGRVREEIEAALALWSSVLEGEAAAAIEAGDLPTDADPAQVAFELGAIALAVNQAIQLRGDELAAERGRRAFGRVLSP